MPLIDFITTFNNSNKNVYKIDPLNTFSLEFIQTYPLSNSILEKQLKTCGFSDGIGEFNSNLNKFVQEIDLPNFNITTDTNADTLAHTAITHKMYLNPDSQTFSLTVLNTKVPILEEVFYPWLREVQYPSWNYADYPYTTADLRINLTSHSDVSYVILSCRPTNITSYNPSHELGPITRSITFTFDLMYIEFSGQYTQSSLNNLSSKLIQKGLKTIGL